ncbi:MAG: flagellar basal body rod protein FlgF [Rhodocyclales bacterium]|nr:flagellar basal body rod protein FlgF [Rhodocyclales bacterium]
MDRLIYTAMTGASQTLGRQASVAHNLANAASNGYRAEAHRLRAVQVQAQDQARATALPTRAFVVDASTYSDFTQGPLVSTGRSLDVAVQGEGWIAVTGADGREAYTRNGALEISVNGVLQTSSGLPVAQGDGGALSIPPETKVSIGKDGVVSVIPETGAQSAVSSIGRIKLVNPPPADLVRGPDGLFRMKDGSAAPVSERTEIASGYVENSNVNPVEEMVTMISLARQFEMQMKVITSADQNDRSATQVINAR